MAHGTKAEKLLKPTANVGFVSTSANTDFDVSWTRPGQRPDPDVPRKPWIPQTRQTC
jgi:hypothetical protein